MAEQISQEFKAAYEEEAEVTQEILEDIIDRQDNSDTQLNHVISELHPYHLKAASQVGHEGACRELRLAHWFHNHIVVKNFDVLFAWL